MPHEMILVETHGAVGLIRLNRPAVLNALCDTLMAELAEQLRAFDADIEAQAAKGIRREEVGPSVPPGS